MYIVCPVVGSSSGDAADADSASMADSVAASSSGDGGSGSDATKRTVLDEYERLRKAAVFGAATRVGQLHGRMKGDEKALALQQFSRYVPPTVYMHVPGVPDCSASVAFRPRPQPCRLSPRRSPYADPCSGETPVLIASTVIEVGIDEPEASIMLVENANCFGMAQLHQLRGRVGRGSRNSRCFLMTPDGDEPALRRLQVRSRGQGGILAYLQDFAAKLRNSYHAGHGAVPQRSSHRRG